MLSEGLFIRYGLCFRAASYIGDTPALQKWCLKKKVVIINRPPRRGEQEEFRSSHKHSISTASGGRELEPSSFLAEARFLEQLNEDFKNKLTGTGGELGGDNGGKRGKGVQEHV